MIDIEEASNKLKSLREEYKKVGQENINKLLKDMFVEYPELKKMAWSQCTPYFNDGEECVFGVGEIYFIENEEVASNPELSGYDYDEYDEGEGVYSRWASYHKEAKYGEISGFISDNEDIMKEFLGDHIHVSVTREGIETEEYEHD